MAHPDTVVVLTTIPVGFDVEALARQLLGQRLAACVSALPPMRSTYRWQGTIETADERQVLIKTRRECVEALEAAVRAAHPYEVPEFLVLTVAGGSQDYLDWLRAEAAAPGS